MSSTITRERSRRGRRRSALGPRERALVGVELGTGAMALLGGALLAVRPDGSLLHAEVSALANSPFRDYRLPGVLLAVLVGGGFVGTGLWQRAERRSPESSPSSRAPASSSS